MQFKRRSVLVWGVLAFVLGLTVGYSLVEAKLYGRAASQPATQAR